MKQMFRTCNKDIELRDQEKLVHSTTNRKVEWKDI